MDPNVTAAAAASSIVGQQKVPLWPRPFLNNIRLGQDFNLSDIEDVNSLQLLLAENEAVTSSNMSSVEYQVKTLKENMDVFFLIVMGIIIFLMQGGFAFLEAGSVRSKNTTNIIIKNMLDVFLCSLVGDSVPYSLLYKAAQNYIGEEWDSYDIEPRLYAYWSSNPLYGKTCTVRLSTIDSGQCRLTSKLVFKSPLWKDLHSVVYPIVSHWAWSSSGWLASGYYQDFAGSGVVHLTGGVAGFVGCVCLGPRMGRFGPGGKRIDGHSLPLAALGGFILLFGFLAFNGGSQGAISGEGDAEAIATAIINTVIAGSAAGLFTLLIGRFPCYHGTWGFALTLNGALTGMKIISIALGAYFHWGPFLSTSENRTLDLSITDLQLPEVDDPLDAVAVHAGGGLWGLIAVALFKPDGIFFAGEHSGQTLGWNLAGALSITVWTGAISVVMFGSLKYFGWLRVSQEIEEKGLDLAKHGEAAYPAKAWHEEQYMNNNNNDINLPPVMCANTSQTPTSLRRAQFRDLKEQVSLKSIKMIKSCSQSSTPTSFVNNAYKFDTDTEIMTRNLPEVETT
ncbi:unnamed protein product, partial [Meganyctiphanes norvegica]